MSTDIASIVEAFRKGDTILYPTDTLWGLGCDATNTEAVEKIFAIKQRADAKSLIVLVDNEDMLCRYVQEIPPLALDIAQLSDSPQTIIYPTGMGLANGVCAADGSVAIRIVQHEFCRQIIRQLRRPIISTSANISGQTTPTSFKEISEEIKRAVNVCVPITHEGMPTGKPSSIIKLELDGRVQVIR
ncbi:MAG: L-threonylcarbamoyladenylate synthase [Bacteroidales bacterium]